MIATVARPLCAPITSPTTRAILPARSVVRVRRSLGWTAFLTALLRAFAVPAG
jgi:hypothetical protein